MNSTSIRFLPLTLDSLSLCVHFDSSWNNLPYGGRQGAYIILLKDNNNFISPIEWSSTKIRRVARSTVTAETLAMLDACDAVFFISKIVTELPGWPHYFWVKKLGDLGDFRRFLTLFLGGFSGKLGKFYTKFRSF